MTASLVPERGYPPATAGLVVVWGLLASAPFGGMTWQVLHHLAGFRRLGYDVWYVEESDSVYAPSSLDYARDLSGNVRFLHEQMSAIGLADRWLFRALDQDGEWLGHGDSTTAERLHRTADAVVNLCGTRWIDEADAPPNVLYLETDPGDRQIYVAEGNREVTRQLQAYPRLFTYGENVGGPEFSVPTAPLQWRPTRPPVIPEWWATAEPPRSAGFTTISQWKTIASKETGWAGRTFEWRKDHLFKRFLDLPARTTVALELALRHVGDDQPLLEEHGWAVRDSAALDPPEAYRRYIRESAGEFTIAKDQYTQLRTGWFSDRSACYLAAGRPVVTQSTGFESHVPTGDGLFAFTTIDEAAGALDAIAGDYAHHSEAATEIAREYFATDRLLPDLLASD